MTDISYLEIGAHFLTAYSAGYATGLLMLAVKKMLEQL